jgi:hypothetical protein
MSLGVFKRILAVGSSYSRMKWRSVGLKRLLHASFFASICYLINGLDNFFDNSTNSLEFMFRP